MEKAHTKTRHPPFGCCDYDWSMIMIIIQVSVVSAAVATQLQLQWQWQLAVAFGGVAKEQSTVKLLGPV